MKRILKLNLVLISILLLSSCSGDKIKIALSKGSGGQSYANYSEWLESYGNDVEIVDIYASDDPIKDLLECDALVLTGGPDVHPGRFDKAYESDRCSIDENRDTLEFELLRNAFLYKMPVLGICRGQQLINVALGGSLIIDIPKDITNPVIHQVEDGDAIHRLFLEGGTYLRSIAGVDSALVNSNHHQAIDKLSRELKPTGYTRDGIIESYEWKDVSFKSWMLAVQWHPERLERNHPLSEPIAKEFIIAANKFHKKLKTK